MSGGTMAGAWFFMVGCAGLLAGVATTRTRPIAATAPAATPNIPTGRVEPRPPVAGKWNLIWRDEFDGAALDPVWHPAQYWDKDHTVVGGGEPRPTTGPPFPSATEYCASRPVRSRNTV